MSYIFVRKTVGRRPQNNRANESEKTFPPRNFVIGENQRPNQSRTQKQNPGSKTERAEQRI